MLALNAKFEKATFGWLFLFQPAQHAHPFACEAEKPGEKKAPGYSGAFYSDQIESFRSIQLLQIHVQLHAAQGAAVPCGAAAIAHATQRGGLKLVLGYFQAKKQIGVFVALFTA